MPVASDKRVRDVSFKWLHSNCCNKSRARQRTFGAYFVFYIHLLASGNLKKKHEKPHTFSTIYLSAAQD